MNKINLIDNSLPLCHATGLYGTLLEGSWALNRQGNRFYPDNNTRLTKDFTSTSDMELLVEILKEASNYIDMELMEVSEAYANLYTNETVTTIHTDHWDSDAITVLYFATPEWEINWGGEIVFFSEDKELEGGFSYRPNRLMIFPSNTPHRVATVSPSARLPRMSIAIKLVKKGVTG
jgi:Rps23 Pro-64 3,4-dihydroxylase Tpa1-like proline 4-hydroxylase